MHNLQTGKKQLQKQLKVDNDLSVQVTTTKPQI